MKIRRKIEMKKIIFIGAGSMTEAMISGMIETKLLKKEQIWATNKGNEERLQQLMNTYGINTSYDKHELFQDADIVILAMKPKDATVAIKDIKPFLQRQLIISLLAGVSMITIEKLIDQPLPIVRAMPNTSAAVSQSATALTMNNLVTREQKTLSKTLFDTIGLTVFVNEEQLDAVTGLSGSGPAYFYYFVEALEKSAIDLGLEQALAKDLILQTLRGAVSMVEKSSKTPEQLRKDVTSPGGTTEAGISVLDEYKVQEAIISCIKNAAAHSEKMGKALSSESNGLLNI